MKKKREGGGQESHKLVYMRVRVYLMVNVDVDKQNTCMGNMQTITC